MFCSFANGTTRHLVSTCHFCLCLCMYLDLYNRGSQGEDWNPRVNSESETIESNQRHRNQHPNVWISVAESALKTISWINIVINGRDGRDGRDAGRSGQPAKLPPISSRSKPSRSNQHPGTHQLKQGVFQCSSVKLAPCMHPISFHGRIAGLWETPEVIGDMC